MSAIEVVMRQSLIPALLALALTLVLAALLASPGSIAIARSSAFTSTPTWSDFQPEDWVSQDAIVSSVVVAPTQATTPTASFRFQNADANNWSTWLGVATIVVLQDGYRLSTPSIEFVEGTANKVQFRLNVGQTSFLSEQYSVKVDRTPPIVTVTSPLIGSGEGFQVSWSSDDSGSGILTDSLEIAYRINDGQEWVDWLTAPQQSSAVFGPEEPTQITAGDRVHLRVRVRDQAGLIGSAETTTTIGSRSPYLPLILVRYTAPTPTPTVTPTSTPTPTPTPTPPPWVRAELNGERIRDLASDVGNSMVMYAASQANGVYRNTVCSNLSWSPIGPDGRFALSVLADDNVLLVGTFGNSVFRREGSGAWVSVNVGNPYVWALVKDSSGKIYAGTDAGVFRSQNQGASWDPWIGGLVGDALLINDIWVDSENVWAATYGRGVYRRPIDGTNSWLPVTGLSGNALRAWTLAQDGSNMLVGTEAGVFRLNDTTWEPFGLPAQIVYALTVSQDGVRYAGTRSGGVFVRTSTANNWSDMNAGWPPDTFVYDLLISSPCNVIFAATRDGVWQYPLP